MQKGKSDLPSSSLLGALGLSIIFGAKVML
jgi:hypothetical protein